RCYSGECTGECACPPRARTRGRRWEWGPLGLDAAHYARACMDLKPRLGQSRRSADHLSWGHCIRHGITPLTDLRRPTLAVRALAGTSIRHSGALQLPNSRAAVPDAESGVRSRRQAAQTRAPPTREGLTGEPSPSTRVRTPCSDTSSRPLLPGL